MKPFFSLALLAFPAWAAFPNGYVYCKVVTTQHSMVSGANDLANYPLTVTLTDPDLKLAGNGGMVNNINGYDIGFYPDCSGSGQALKWEMESYAPATGAIVAHVLRPTLSHTANDTIGMYYGGAFSTPQSLSSAVWNSSFKGVFHLSGAGPDVTDSTGALTITNHSVAAGTGQIDGGAVLNGSSAYLSIANGFNPLSGNNTHTVSAWVKGTGFSASPMIFEVVGSTGDSFFLEANSTGTGMYWGYRSPGHTNVRTYSSMSPSLSDNAFHLVTAVKTGAGDSGTLYIDGVPQTVGSGSIESVATESGVAMLVGAYAGPSLFWPGRVDEVRISNIARSADWILTEFRNQSAPGTYLSTGPRLTGEGSRVRHSVRGGI